MKFYLSLEINLIQYGKNKERKGSLKQNFNTLFIMKTLRKKRDEKGDKLVVLSKKKSEKKLTCNTSQHTKAKKKKEHMKKKGKQREK